MQKSRKVKLTEEEIRRYIERYNEELAAMWVDETRRIGRFMEVHIRYDPLKRRKDAVIVVFNHPRGKRILASYFPTVIYILSTRTKKLYLVKKRHDDRFAVVDLVTGKQVVRSGSRRMFLKNLVHKIFAAEDEEAARRAIIGDYDLVPYLGRRRITGRWTRRLRVILEEIDDLFNE